MKLHQILDYALAANVPLNIVGLSGIGKTAIVNDYAHKKGYYLEPLIASIRDPIDFGGVMMAKGDRMVVEPMPWVHRVNAAGKAIVFLDEITRAPVSVQNALLKVVLEGIVGDVKLKNTVRFVLACNPPDVCEGAYDLVDALANRCMHFNYSVSAEDWVKGFFPYWDSAASFTTLNQSRWREERMQVCAFISARPHMLIQMPKSESEKGKAWPSPRAWDHATRLMSVLPHFNPKNNHDLEIAAEIHAGCVGEGVAIEYMNFRKEQDLPDLHDLLKNPGKLKLPQRDDMKYAIILGVVNIALENIDNKKWINCWEILSRAVEQGARDIAAAGASMLVGVFFSEKGKGLTRPTEGMAPIISLLKESGILKLEL